MLRYTITFGHELRRKHTAIFNLLDLTVIGHFRPFQIIVEAPTNEMCDLFEAMKKDGAKIVITMEVYCEENKDRQKELKAERDRINKQLGILKSIEYIKNLAVLRMDTYIYISGEELAPIKTNIINILEKRYEQTEKH